MRGCEHYARAERDVAAARLALEQGHYGQAVALAEIGRTEAALAAAAGTLRGRFGDPAEDADGGPRPRDDERSRL